MKIDLSKKPNGATHINPHSGVWVKCFGGNAGSYQFFQNGEWEMGFGCMSNSYLEIAQPEPWTGEGLPPVGTVCEFAGFNPEETLPADPRVGDQVTVIANFMSGSFEVAAFTFYAPPEFEYLQVAQGAYGCFRPIRTPEQIAAEEKAKAADSLFRSMWPNETLHECEPGNPNWRACLNAIDAGYRKQVAIKLPEKCEYADPQSEYAKGHRQGKRDVVDCIEAAGLKVIP